MKLLTLFFLLSLSSAAFGQWQFRTDTLQPPAMFENVHARLLQQDSLQSVFVIWVKKEVKMHYHREHTESILVLEGRATMLLGDQELEIRTGDYVLIPKGTRHAVTAVHGRKPLKVISIQAPWFDGKDRIMVE